MKNFRHIPKKRGQFYLHPQLLALGKASLKYHITSSVNMYLSLKDKDAT